MAPHSRRKLTYQDFERIPEDRFRHEVLDGVHLVSSSPGTLHQRISFRLVRKLDNFVAANRLGEVFFGPFDVVLARHDIVEPDILFISTDRAAILTEANVQGAPDLLVEILTPITRRRDLGAKRATSGSGFQSTGLSTPRPRGCGSSGARERAFCRLSCSRPRRGTG